MVKSLEHGLLRVYCAILTSYKHHKTQIRLRETAVTRLLCQRLLEKNLINGYIVRDYCIRLKVKYVNQKPFINIKWFALESKQKIFWKNKQLVKALDSYDYIYMNTNIGLRLVSKEDALKYKTLGGRPLMCINYA